MEGMSLIKETLVQVSVGSETHTEREPHWSRDGGVPSREPHRAGAEIHFES
jgi:hypothetical protein